MKKELKEVEINADNNSEINYELIDNEELITMYQKLKNINDPYFTNIINTIENDVNFENLYMDNNLSNDEKFIFIRREINNILNKIKDIIDNDITLEKKKEKTEYDEIYLEINLALDNLSKNLQEMNLQEKLDAEVNDSIKTNESFSNSNDIKNTIVAANKLFALNDNDEFKEYLKKQNLNITKNIKGQRKLLSNYKIKWIWYVVIMAVLFVAAILCIVIPIYA